MALNLKKKMLLWFLTSMILVAAVTIGYISFNARNRAYINATSMVDNTSAKFAKIAENDLNKDYLTAKSLSHVFSLYESFSDSMRNKIYREIQHKVLEENPHITSLWLHWELYAIDPNYTKDFGRVRNTFYRAGDEIKLNIDTMNLNGDDENSIYYKIKTSMEETITEPYFYSYTKIKEDEILETSIAIPINKNNKFMGLIGVDLNLERFNEIIQDIKPFNNSVAFLVSNKGTFVAHHNTNYIGKTVFDVCKDYAEKEKLGENIGSGKSFSYTKINDDGNESYISYSPLFIGDTKTPWSLAVEVPKKVILKEANQAFNFSMLVGFVGVLLLVFIIIFIANKISAPLIRASKVLKKMALGEINLENRLNVETKDEVGEISASVNTLIEALEQTSYFARNIGEGNLTAEYKPLSKNDTLGNALLEMRDSLMKAKDDEEKRNQEEAIQKWITNGLAKFGDILRQHNTNLHELSFQFLSNLLNYIDAIQGAIFIKNEDAKNEVYYETTAAIAYNREKILNKKIHEGEELVGRCVHEKLTIYMIDVPDDYVNITSGLGQANPNCLLLVPLIANDEVLGVIEILSFKTFDDYKIEFVEKIAETIASTIAGVKINQRTAQLLEQSQQQGEELAAQEEEMRQNMEELQATHEEMQRKENELNQTIEKLKAELDNLKR